MMEIKDLSVFVNTRCLIKSLSLNLDKGDKLAIIGEEGNGKTTLLKAIMGIDDYATITGIVNLKGNKIGYLEQLMDVDTLKKSVYEFLLLDETDYYNKINDLYKKIACLNLDNSLLNQNMKTLSGGERVKVGILKILLDDCDILFLDEPTNDLDIDTLIWLEDFIVNTNKPIIYISHDETLLANTANVILHIEQVKNKTECKHTLIELDYNSYVERRLSLIFKQQQISKSEERLFNKKQEKLNQIMQKVEHQQENISRSDPHGAKMLKKKMHSLKSQEKRLNESDLTEMPCVEEEIYFRFEEVSIPKSKVILKLDIDKLEIENKVLSKNIKLEVIGSEHICITGNNGVGKTTLMKKILDLLMMRKDIKVGYMPQVYEDILNKYNNALEFITDSKEKDIVTKARMYLGNMNFTKEEMLCDISNLSNGTKAKLFLIKLVLDKCNVLILDEPTRNVSPLSNPIIRSVLKNFNGTIISISHDRKYIEEVIDSLYLLTENGLEQKKD